MKLQRMLTGLIVFSVLGTAATAADKAYQIKLERPSKAGDKHRISVTFSQKQEMSVSREGTVLQERKENNKATLVATTVINEVDKEGSATKKTVTIEKFVDAEGKALLKKGQVVIVQTVDGKPAYRLKEGELDPKAKKLFGFIVKTKSVSTTNEDKVFGSKTPRQVGESWKMDADRAATELKVKAGSVKGTVKLNGVEKSGGKECLRITVDATISDFPNSEMLTKQGYDLKEPVFKLKMSGLFPTDLNSDAPKKSMNMTMKTEMVGARGAVKGIVIKMNIEMSMKGTYKPL